MKDNEVKKVVIIGSGIAGPALALFLKKAGIATEIFEATPQGDNLGAGLNLATNGMRVLAELGLAEKIILQGSIAHDCVLKNSRNRKLAKFKYTDIKKYDYPNVNISRPLLIQLLRDELTANEIPIHYEKKLESILQTENGVDVFFTDGTRCSADILVGTDGVRSRVREFVLERPVDPMFTGIIGSGGFVAKSLIPALSKGDIDDLNFIYGTEGFFGYTGVSKDRMMWWTNIKADQAFSRESLKNFNPATERANLLAQYASYGFPIPDIIKHSENFVRVNVFDVASLPNWSNRRIIVIGDAAHAVSPNSGQGASMALEDTMLLAKLIRDEKSYSSAFLKFEQLRKPRVEKIVAEGRKRGDDKTVVGWFGQIIRELMIRVFVNLFGEKGNRWLFEYKIDWSKSNIIPK